MFIVKMKTKLLIPMFIITIILTYLGGMLFFSYYSKSASLDKLDKKIILSSKISDTLHSLQKERGLSCGYVVNKNEKFKKELIVQRKQTDKNIEKMKSFLDKISDKKFKKDMEKLFLKLSTLDETRTKIDKYDFSYEEAINYYSNINTIFLKNIVEISKSSHIPKITQNILTYINFLYLKENMGIERAKGVAIFSQNKITRDRLIKFSNTLTKEKQSEDRFLQYATKATKDYYKNSIDLTSFYEVNKMRNIILYKNLTEYNIDSKFWYLTVTKNLNTLDNIGKFIKSETTKNIEKELKKAFSIFVFIAFLTLISIIALLFIIRALIKLADEEQRLRLVQDKYIISSVTDLKGTIIDVSQAFCNISGYTKSELIGKNHNIVRHPDMPKEVFKELWQTISKGNSWSNKVKNLKKDGGDYWVYANIEPLYDKYGKIDSYVSIRLDITQNELLNIKIKEEEARNMAAKQMIQQQSRLAQMGEMLSMIAHQWRQPLSAITAAAGSITLKAKLNKLDNETTIKLSNKIKEFSQHLSVTIDDFRDFFKTNKVKTKTNFDTIITAVLGIIESSIQNNNIKIVKTVKANYTFLTYENELKQVLLNIMKNAEDALVEKSPEEAIIFIEAYDNVIKISDNAGGIPDNIIEKVFDPYFSTKTEKNGTGLGLYMSKTIIEDHCNGKLTLNNNKLGAEFKIILGEIE